MADSESPVTLRTRKFIRNPLLGRKQMVVYVHLNLILGLGLIPLAPLHRVSIVEFDY